ncbi:serine-rich adhesin for platelets-like [Teleopsis dalmanni]|uniref:serine-rich adhesin for platelets-like n=1 Tax=Teleopsis dalmanni TaxID=139649 RepID=UPI0018CCE475|nr:serine-rich adhesin for platelets-like [Teleopsis dalmanni]
MARKMKAMNESDSPTTTPLMAQNIVTSEKVKEILTKDFTEHANNSDSEIIEISNITAKKNKSTLFLIKSYSFNETIKQTTPKQINKFVNKMKSSKAPINDKVDVYDDDEDYSEILRKPAKIFENGLPPTPNTTTKIKQKSRPKSMPTNISASVTNAGVAIVSTPRTSVKRSSASFIRQSFQTIRRSFRTTKKLYESSNGKNVTTPKTTATTTSIVASSVSTSSNTTTASSTSSAGSTIDFTLVNQVGVEDEEEDAIFYEGVEGENGDIDAAGIVIMLNGIATQMFNEQSMCNGIGTGDALAVLQEEDDTDLSTKQAQVSTKTNIKSFSKTHKRSTSSVGALAYGTSDKCSTALQSHAEAHSVNCLNTLHNSSSPVQKSEKPSKHKRQLSQQLSISGSIQSGNSSTNSSLNENYQNLSPLGSQKSEASIELTTFRYNKFLIYTNGLVMSKKDITRE